MLFPHLALALNGEEYPTLLYYHDDEVWYNRVEVEYVQDINQYLQEVSQKLYGFKSLWNCNADIAPITNGGCEISAKWLWVWV